MPNPYKGYRFKPSFPIAVFFLTFFFVSNAYALESYTFSFQNMDTSYGEFIFSSPTLNQYANLTYTTEFATKCFDNWDYENNCIGYARMNSLNPGALLWDTNYFAMSYYSNVNTMGTCSLFYLDENLIIYNNTVMTGFSTNFNVYLISGSISVVGILGVEYINYGGTNYYQGNPYTFYLSGHYLGGNIGLNTITNGSDVTSYPIDKMMLCSRVSAPLWGAGGPTSIASLTFYNVTLSGTNELPEIDVYVNDSTVCYSNSGKTARLDFSIEATDLEGDDIYYYLTNYTVSDIPNVYLIDFTHVQEDGYIIDDWICSSDYFYTPNECLQSFWGDNILISGDFDKTGSMFLPGNTSFYLFPPFSDRSLNLYMDLRLDYVNTSSQIRFLGYDFSTMIKLNISRNDTSLLLYDNDVLTNYFPYSGQSFTLRTYYNSSNEKVRYYIDLCTTCRNATFEKAYKDLYAFYLTFDGKHEMFDFDLMVVEEFEWINNPTIDFTWTNELPNNWTTTYTGSQQFKIYYTDLPHLGLNYDYKTIFFDANDEYCYVFPVGEDKIISVRDTLNILPHGKIKFNNAFFIGMFFTFIFLLISIKNLELSFTIVGIIFAFISWLMSGDYVQFMSSLFIFGFGVTMIVVKSI